MTVVFRLTACCATCGLGCVLVSFILVMDMCSFVIGVLFITNFGGKIRIDKKVS